MCPKKQWILHLGWIQMVVLPDFIFKGWILSNGRSIEAYNISRAIQSGQSLYKIQFMLPSDIKGLCKLTYAFYLPVNGQEDLLLAGGSKSFDAVDIVPPVISGKAVNLQNSNGWYNKDVTVHFEAVDNETGIRKLTDDVKLSTEGKNQSTKGFAEDWSGNSSSITVEGINIDKTSPEVELISPVTGIYKPSDTIKVSFNVTDNLSGIDSYSALFNGVPVENGSVLKISSLDGDCIFSIIAIDKAGNVSKKREVITLKKSDITPPVITAKTTTQPNSNGWYSSNVVVHFDATDNELALIPLYLTVRFQLKGQINCLLALL